MKIVVGHLYPDYLNIYADRGNIAVLERRSAWRGIELDYRTIGLGEAVRPGELADAWHEVVALDVRDVDAQTELLRELTYGRRTSGGVETPCVGDDADALLPGGAERFLELAQERRRVTLGGILHLRPEEDQHRELGEVVAGQDVEIAAVEHLAHRGEPVAVETGTVADAHRTRHGRTLSRLLHSLAW